jgi:hypothetical protein
LRTIQVSKVNICFLPGLGVYCIVAGINVLEL